MRMNGSMEVVSFQMAAGTKQADALAGIRSLDEFYRGTTGYRGMQAAQDDQDGTWILVLNWDEAESEKKASAAMMGSAKTNGFKQLVVPQTVTKKLYPCYASPGVE
jgi:hypothetical protein